MATRKQLSDVLREEANKMPESQTGSENTAKPSQPAVANSAAAKTASTAQPKKPKASSVEAPVDAASIADTAQLNDTISGLKAALDDAQVSAGVLQRKIDALESDLAEQRTLVQQLQTDQEQTKQAKTELAEAKRVIVQLSDLNSKLETAAKALPPAQATPQTFVATKSPQTAKPTATPPAQPSGASTVHPGHTASQRSQIELHRMFDHPVLPAPPSTSLSDDEIGWVD